MQIIDLWLKKNELINKNDFYDMDFLGILNRNEEILMEFQRNRPDQYKLIDARIVAVTFDKIICDFLEAHHPLSHQEIRRFYE